MKTIFISLSLIFISQSVLAEYITQNTTNGCVDNIIGIDNNNHVNLFAVFTRSQYNCPSGQYLPADTDHCELCTYGHSCSGGTYTFNENTSQGIEVSSYTCPSGQYLPADIDGCRVCPANGTCGGGNYTFNESSSQGIEFTYPFTQSQVNACINDVIDADGNNHVNLFAVFTVNQYTCARGSYLPADTDGCRPCLQDNYCDGGTFTFNETTDQGITACPNDNKYAPIGSAICYPRRMHISEGVYLHLKATPSTNPSVEINVNGTIYYGNLAPTETQITQTVDRFMPVMVNGVEYFACDDTTCPVTE